MRGLAGCKSEQDPGADRWRKYLILRMRAGPSCRGTSHGRQSDKGGGDDGARFLSDDA